MKVSRWGNSLAVRLPASLVEALDLREGDEIEVKTGGGSILEVTRVPSRDDLMDRLEAFKGWLPAGTRFDRDEANER